MRRHGQRQLACGHSEESIFRDAVGEVRELLFFPAPEQEPGESK